LADDLNRKLRTPGMKLNDMDEYVNYSIFGATAHKPQNDLMRVIAASDSDTVKSEQALELSRMRLFSLTGGGQSGDFKLHPRYLETVRPGVTFAGDFAINTQLLDMAARLSRWRKDQTKYFSYKELLQRLNIFARDIINWELSYFKKLRNPGIYQIKEFYSKLRDLLSELKENEALLCIGYGISWHKMTVGLLMEQRKNFNFVHFRSTLRLAKEYLRFEFPKSRRLVLSDENKAKYPYGWMRLTLL
jgi:CRISPR type III-A-associated RAMP protein Csm5